MLSLVEYEIFYNNNHYQIIRKALLVRRIVYSRMILSAGSDKNNAVDST